MSDPYYGTAMSNYDLCEYEFHRQAGEYRGWEPSIEDIRDALKKPVPHSAEVSATVARHWHLGLAEDAGRRARRYDKARGMGGWLRFGRIQRLHLYFEALAADHRQAVEGVTR